MAFVKTGTERMAVIITGSKGARFLPHDDKGKNNSINTTYKDKNFSYFVPHPEYP
jgi:hypothetical protein